MSVFSISVDKGVQSLRDDGAVDGGPTKYSALLIHLLILFIHKVLISLGGVYRLRVKVSLRIHRRFLLSFGGVAGVHIVWRNGPSNGT